MDGSEKGANRRDNQPSRTVYHLYENDKRSFRAFRPSVSGAGCPASALVKYCGDLRPGLPDTPKQFGVLIYGDHYMGWSMTLSENALHCRLKEWPSIEIVSRQNNGRIGGLDSMAGSTAAECSCSDAA